MILSRLLRAAPAALPLLALAACGKSVDPKETWAAYTRTPYSAKAFADHMRAVSGQMPHPARIAGVFRAARANRPPLWIVEVWQDKDIREGTQFNLVVLGPEGELLRILGGDSILCWLSARFADQDRALKDIANNRAADLPDLNGDSCSEILAVRGGGASVYRTDDESIPCAFRIEWKIQYPFENIPSGLCGLRHPSPPDGTLTLVVQPQIAHAGETAPDRSKPVRTLAEFRWDPGRKTFTGPAEGPNGIWKVLPRD